MPETSVIIVNWNGIRYLEDCLSSLRRQTFQDFEVLLVDNGSRDGSVVLVREKFPEVKVLPLSENLGFAAGNVAGYENSCGKLLVLLNNDTEAHPRWLEELHRASELFPTAGAFASKMLYLDDRGRIDNCGFGLSPVGIPIDVGRDQEHNHATSDYRWVFGACGGAAAYRRELVKEIGLFDPDFFMIYEDVDFAFRAQLRGIGCVHVPRAIVYHRFHGTLKKFPARRVFFSQRNVEYVYLKNMPLALILRYIPHRLLYELGGAIYFTRQGTGLAFLKAKASVLWSLPKLLRKRRQIQRHRKVSSAYIALLMMHRAWLWNKWQKFASAWRPPHGRPESLRIETQGTEREDSP